MTDTKSPEPHAGEIPAASTPSAAPTVGQEWKPEPRQWTWKDLFTAPMLAFKTKCMIVSALTLLAVAVWMWLHGKLMESVETDSPTVQHILAWFGLPICVVIFSLGASLVAIFLKADLLDDEFLTWGEALQQYKGRLIPALLVPVFLMALLLGVRVAMVHIPILLASIPYVGPTVYAALYPLFFLGSLFVILLSIAIWLSVFVFPSIIAIRKHGWFDNVVDTIEAVGTKPHVLAGSLALTLLMMFIAFRVGLAGINQLKEEWVVMPERVGTAVRTTEVNANDFGASALLRDFDRLILDPIDVYRLHNSFLSTYHLGPGELAFVPHEYGDNPAYYRTITGPVAGVWQCLIEALLLGYVLNLFISGGMLTYLVVREDDYWDDENLEDLDQLAKELEEEAKRDQTAGGPAKPAAAATAAPLPPATGTVATGSTPTPAP